MVVLGHGVLLAMLARPVGAEPKLELIRVTDSLVPCASAQRIRCEYSCLNPDHERRAAQIVHAELPGAHLSVSSEVCAEFREYPRASTAAVNAAVMPVVADYLTRLSSRLRDQRIRAPFYIMQSNGGVMGIEAAKVKPVYMVESGPAAGVIAAAAIGRSLGRPNVISLDMGGTTAKVGLIQDGRPKVTTDFEVGAVMQRTVGEGKGGGYPVRTPVIDLVEVGAGGGSLAWIDSGGALRIGRGAPAPSPRRWGSRRWWCPRRRAWRPPPACWTPTYATSSSSRAAGC